MQAHPSLNTIILKVLLLTAALSFLKVTIKNLWKLTMNADWPQCELIDNHLIYVITSPIPKLLEAYCFLFLVYNRLSNSFALF